MYDHIYNVYDHYSYEFRNEISIMPKWKMFSFQKKIQKKHSVIMDFPLQWVHSCETVNEGISITRMGTGRKCSAYTIYNPVLILHL